MINWMDLAKRSTFDRAVLEFLGLGEAYRFPRDMNPITGALKNRPDFIEVIREFPGFSRNALSRLATLAQMSLYDATQGPDNDGKPKGLRRHWYSWYKSDFAQPLALALGDYEMDGGLRVIKDIAWSGRLSTTYADLVDSGAVTYRDLWVEDASRMMARMYEKLFDGFNLVIAVEKDSLHGDFIAAGRAMGATVVYSGKGKGSKAATEKMLRQNFNWSEGYNPFSEENPLIFLYISDYDYDGESVIGPTFAEQARRYTPHIIEARVGVKPEDISAAGHDLPEKWYQIKIGNSGYVSWAEEKAFFVGQCLDCEEVFPVMGASGNVCPHCGGAVGFLNPKADTAYGFEVESLKTRDYYRLLVETLLQIVPFDLIVKKLRFECVASAYDAADQLAAEICQKNPDYRRLNEEFRRLKSIMEDFEGRARETLERVGSAHYRDFQDTGEDPAPEDFVNHVQRAGDWANPWRPFDPAERTMQLIELLRKESSGDIAEIIAEEIDF